MIKIARMSEIRRGQYDLNFAIVRSMKNPSDWLVQEDLLSPSKNLFYKYLDLKKAGNWNKKSFDEIYVPQFLRELKANKSATDKLNEIYSLSKTKSIALCCFCDDEELCHRSIIAGLLQGAGADVVASKDYRHYYEMYRAL